MRPRCPQRRLAFIVMERTWTVPNWPTPRAEVAERAAVGALMPSDGASVASSVAEDPSIAASIASYTGTIASYSGTCSSDGGACSSYGAGGASYSGRCPSYGTMCPSYVVGIPSDVGTDASDTATTRADGASIASYSGPIRPNEWGWRRSGGPIDLGGDPIAWNATSVERTRGPDAGGDAPQEATRRDSRTGDGSDPSGRRGEQRVRRSHH